MPSGNGFPMDYLPFQTISFNETQYKLFGIVANMDWEWLCAVGVGAQRAPRREWLVWSPKEGLNDVWMTKWT